MLIVNLMLILPIIIIIIIRRRRRELNLFFLCAGHKVLWRSGGTAALIPNLGTNGIYGLVQ